MATLADYLQQLRAAANAQGTAGPVGSGAYQTALQAAFAAPQAPSAPQAAPQSVSPQVTGSIQPQAPQSAPAAPPAPNTGIGGLFQGLANILNPQAAGRNATINYLTKQGYDPGTAMLIAGDKPLLRQVLIGGKGKSEFDQRAVAAQQFGLDPTSAEGRDFILTGNLDGGSGDLTADMKEYEYAKRQGFTGTLMDYMVKMREAGRNQVNINTGVKLPAGYQWVDPNDQSKGVEPIAGGPATTIPAESAGRIGLADTFLANYPTLRKKILAGEVTGPIDRFEAKNVSSSDAAETYRQIQSGVDALQRMLTGAGMPASEAAQYAFRYLPTYTDDAPSMAAKLDRLRNELTSVKTTTLRGRGGNIPNPAPQGSESAPSSDAPPSSYDGDPSLWKYMTPEQKALWK